MLHNRSHNAQMKEAELENLHSSQELRPGYFLDDKQLAAIHKEFIAPTEPNTEASPMTSLPCHMDDTPFVPSCLSGNGGKLEGRELVSPFINTSCIPAKESKISLIRREFVELTNDPLIAAVLNQLVYWSQRVADFDLFWEEEVTSSHAGISSFQYGWFYKSASELLEETMIRVTPITLRRYLSLLMERGWIQTRANPRYKWDRTIQYRVNIRQLYNDLQALGFRLPGFPPEAVFSSFQKKYGEENDSSNVQNLSHNEREILPSNKKSQNFEITKNIASIDQKLPFEENKKFPTIKKPKKSACLKNDPSNLQNLTLDKKEILPSKGTPLHSRREKNVGCNTKIITEITNREHAQRACAPEVDQKNFFEEVLSIWNTCLSQDGLTSGFAPVHLTDERRRKIHVLFSLYFENDLEKWQGFCERVAHSPFLMGQGARKWRVSLDWILVEENLLKILKGNFDDSKILEQRAEQFSGDGRKKEINAILNSIEEAVWRGWCSQLNFSTESKDYVSLLDLKAIANARFLEVEDDRLVWVESSDKQALSKIEDLRLKILPIIQGTFPHARTVRTRLNESASSLQAEIPEPPQLPTTPTQQKGDIHYAE